MELPAFKTCRAHAHGGLTWLHHTQMMVPMHARKILAESYVDVTTHVLHVGHRRPFNIQALLPEGFICTCMALEPRSAALCG